MHNARTRIIRRNPYQPGHPQSPYGRMEAAFGTVVDMDSIVTLPKDRTMATLALRGCTFGYIDNPAGNTMFHYGPGFMRETGDILKLLTEDVSAQTRHVWLAVPGKTIAGKLVPDAEYLGTYLQEEIALLESKGASWSLHGYEMEETGNPHRGTAWLDRAGKFYLEGKSMRATRHAPLPAAKVKSTAFKAF